MDPQLESLLVQFEASWNPQRDLRFSELLTGPAADLTPASRQQLIVEIIKVDLELSWKQGGTTTLEAYGNILPSISLDLLMEEYQVRHKWGDRPDVGEYTKRFGDMGRQLASHLKQTAKLEDTQCVPNPQETPKTVGRFRVVRKIGEGSFATVYLARDPVLDRFVALKVPHQTFLGIEEAVLAASASHPAFVSIYDVIDESVIVMEYINGGTLEDWCASPSYHVDAAISLLADVADALHQAHLLGLVHCDVKPSNILVDQSGQPRIADFGLAVRSDSQGSLAEDGFFGTPAYMSPEQARGETKWLDARSDVWAMGVVLYQVLTKQLPFRGDNLDLLFDQIFYHEPLALRKINATLPGALEEICSDCLSKDIWKRMDCEQLAIRLREACEQKNSLDQDSDKETDSVVLLPNNLPKAQVFIGRDKELDKCRQLLTGNGSIILNVHGPGGMGKTTFAAQVMRNLAAEFTTNLYVSLAHVNDASGLRNAVKFTLGIESDANDDNVIIQTLRQCGDALVFLDNFEQIGDDGAKLLDAWADQLPFAKWLVSSRRRLKLPRERLVSLGPLSQQKSSTGGSLKSECVELFHATALRVAMDFDEESHANIVSQICERLDGIPLAIELAASRVALLDPAQILSRLAEPAFLSSDDLIADERHRTLQQAVEWSLRLLGNEEWDSLKRLSILPAGCTVELAERLLNVDRPLDRVLELANHSILRLVSTDYGKRISIYQPVLDVVRHKIPSDVVGELRDQAAEALVPYCLALEEQLRCSPAKSLIDQLLAERENLLAVQTWASSKNSDETAQDIIAQCAMCIAEPLHTRGLLSEELTFLSTLGPTQAFRFSGPWQARVTIALANNALDRGNLEDAENLASQAELTVAQEALAAYEPACQMLRGAIALAGKHWDQAGNILRAVYDEKGLSARQQISICLDLSRVHANQGDITGAQNLLAEARTAADALENPLMKAKVLRQQGSIWFRHGQLDSAASAFRQSEQLARTAEFPREIHLALTSLGIVSCEQGQFAKAVAMFDEARALAACIGGQRAVAVNDGNRGVALAGIGDHVAAIQCLNRAEETNTRLGNEAAAALNRSNRSLSVAALGDLSEGIELATQAISTLDRTEDHTNAAIARGDLGIMHWLAGDHQAADKELTQAWSAMCLLEMEQSAQAAPVLLLQAEIQKELGPVELKSMQFFRENSCGLLSHLLLPDIQAQMDRICVFFNL